MVMPLIMASMQKTPMVKCAADKLCFAIIVSPLKGLIGNMIEVFRDKYEIRIMHLEGKNDLPSRIMEEINRPASTTRVFILCPESVSDELLRALYFSATNPAQKFVRDHCWGVIHDEAHDIALLGDDFRTAFTSVIQAPAFSSIRLMLMSGTWTLPVVDKIKGLLSHRKDFNFDTATISVEPNRANLYYAFHSQVFLYKHYALQSISLRRFAVDLQPLCDRSRTALRSFSNGFAIAPRSLCDRSAITFAFASLCN
jgi:superfamily II DNA helicase RecQ